MLKEEECRTSKSRKKWCRKPVLALFPSLIIDTVSLLLWGPMSFLILVLAQKGPTGSLREPSNSVLYVKLSLLVNNYTESWFSRNLEYYLERVGKGKVRVIGGTALLMKYSHPVGSSSSLRAFELKNETIHYFQSQKDPFLGKTPNSGELLFTICPFL